MPRTALEGMMSKTLPGRLLLLAVVVLLGAACAPAAPTASRTGAASPAAAAKPAVAEPGGAGPPVSTARSDEQAVGDFYRGKVIRIVVGTAAGSGTDLAVRRLAAHMPRFLPGNPNIVVENK